MSYSLFHTGSKKLGLAADRVHLVLLSQRERLGPGSQCHLVASGAQPAAEAGPAEVHLLEAPPSSLWAAASFVQTLAFPRSGRGHLFQDKDSSPGQ